MTLLDADDWESASFAVLSTSKLTDLSPLSLGAIDEAREASKGRAEGKLEIWVH